MKTPFDPIVAEAKGFLNSVDAGGIHTFQTFDDNSARKAPQLRKVLHGTIDQYADQLVDLNKMGAGVFFMVNRGDGRIHDGHKSCRNAHNVIAVRSLFADLDGAPLEPVKAALHPDIIVISSPGRWHCYWLTNDCPLDQFTWCQERIAEKFGSDKAVKDLPRVMRLPGFFHQKASPFMTKVIHPK
jgi:hypothetical protein